MRNFKPLKSTPQGTRETLLFLDANCTATKLLEPAGYRLGIARELAKTLSGCRSYSGESTDLASVSAVFLLLIEDFTSLYEAATDSVNSQAEG